MLRIKANAKINLFLEITGKLDNGYHTVDTIMQSVSLSDCVDISLAPKSEGIKILCNVPGIPTDERNIAYKTARAYFDRIGADCGAVISIDKNIPSEAGMGGGSADGAAVLWGLNDLCGNALDYGSLVSLAAEKGADIPFCIKGGTQRLQGIGTEPIAEYNSPELPLVIVKPDCGVSTPMAYRCLDSMFGDFSNHSAILPDSLTRSLRNGADIGSDMIFNRFEAVLGDLCPKSKQIIEFLNDKSHGSLLCGSGAAVFAIADSQDHANRLAEAVENHFNGCIVRAVNTALCGCSIL